MTEATLDVVDELRAVGVRVQVADLGPTFDEHGRRFAGALRRFRGRDAALGQVVILNAHWLTGGAPRQIVDVVWSLLLDTAPDAKWGAVDCEGVDAEDIYITLEEDHG